MLLSFGQRCHHSRDGMLHCWIVFGSCAAWRVFELLWPCRVAWCYFLLRHHFTVQKLVYAKKLNCFVLSMRMPSKITRGEIIHFCSEVTSDAVSCGVEIYADWHLVEHQEPPSAKMASKESSRWGYLEERRLSGLVLGELEERTICGSHFDHFDFKKNHVSVAIRTFHWNCEYWMCYRGLFASCEPQTRCYDEFLLVGTMHCPSSYARRCKLQSRQERQTWLWLEP